jgi:hypothetical protein
MRTSQTRDSSPAGAGEPRRRNQLRRPAGGAPLSRSSFMASHFWPMGRRSGFITRRLGPSHVHWLEISSAVGVVVATLRLAHLYVHCLAGANDTQYMEKFAHLFIYTSPECGGGRPTATTTTPPHPNDSQRSTPGHVGI